MKVLLTFLVAVGSAGALAADDSLEWKKFTSERGRFSILMPGEVEQLTVKGETCLGPKAVYQHIARPGDYVHVVQYIVFTSSVKKVPLEQLYDSVRDIRVKGLAGKLVKERKIKLGDYAGRETRIRSFDGEAFDINRMYLVGQRLYEVSGRYPNSNR